jgi:hypothetical protein
MKVMMNNQKRNASYDQWKIVQKAFQKCTLPVYVRLVFEEVRLWHSYDDTETQVLGKCVTEIIDNILDRTERNGHLCLILVRQSSLSELTDNTILTLTAILDGSHSNLCPFSNVDNRSKESIKIISIPPNLVICGETGTGKSAIIAKIASDVNIAIKNEDLAMRTALVFRFVGQTQKAVTAQELLYSLCHQLAVRFRE